MTTVSDDEVRRVAADELGMVINAAAEFQQGAFWGTEGASGVHGWSDRMDAFLATVFGPAEVAIFHAPASSPSLADLADVHVTRLCQLAERVDRAIIRADAEAIRGAGRLARREDHA